MDICDSRHEPTFKITYRPAKGSTHTPEWLVCEFCHEKRIFGTEEDILKIEKLS